MERKLSKLKAGAVISYVSIGINILSGLIFTPWMIGQIGQSNYGIYTLVTSLINLFLIDLGLSSATSRFVAKYRVENNRELMEEFLAAVYKIYLLIDGVIFLVFTIIYLNLEHIYVNFTEAEIEKIKILFIVAGIYSLISFPCTTFQGILTAYEEFVSLKLADVFQRLGTILFTIFALCCGMGLYALVLANVAGGLFAILMKYHYVRRNVRIRLDRRKKKADTGKIYSEIFSFSIWVMIVGLSQRLIFSVTPSILGIVVPQAASAIAVFGIVTTIEGYIYIITTAINGMFLTRITSIIHRDSESGELTELAIKVGRFQYVLNGIIIVGFAIIGKEFIVLWMGEAYEQAYTGILFVVIPGLFYNSLQIAHTAMVAQNLVKYQAYVQMIVGVGNVALSVILSRHYGVLGACLSIFAVYTLRIFLNLLIIKKKINMNLREYIKQCYLKMSVPLLLTYMAAEWCVEKIDIPSWTGIGLKGMVIVGIYIAALYVTGFRIHREE